MAPFEKYARNTKNILLPCPWPSAKSGKQKQNILSMASIHKF